MPGSRAPACDSSLAANGDMVMDVARQRVRPAVSIFSTFVLQPLLRQILPEPGDLRLAGNELAGRLAEAVAFVSEEQQFDRPLSGGDLIVEVGRTLGREEVVRAREQQQRRASTHRVVERRVARVLFRIVP